MLFIGKKVGVMIEMESKTPSSIVLCNLFLNVPISKHQPSDGPLQGFNLTLFIKVILLLRN